MTGTALPLAAVPAASASYAGWILLGAAVLLTFFVIGIYNRLVALRNNRENAFADVDVQLKLRFDLVPNLVETVKGYAKHESSTLEAVIAARSKYLGASKADDKIEASNLLTGALKSVFALSEAYPDLKANQNFASLQAELSDVENKVAAARRFFNSATNEYNTSRDTFPAVLLAGMFGFPRAKMFEVEDRAAAEAAPKIAF